MPAGIGRQAGLIQSFARHFGTSLMRREGAAFQRIAKFKSGGKMRCGPEKDIGLLCLQHYFLGDDHRADGG
jgi:hypothetical protein